ncbi:2-C-methyl-D-erythritol 2,4-cyclodiphosphate synthase, chloroplastic [Typha angustifolia]|uniref:2-C-methyl-D-erythritol 2,4-cyclodiphosphate synthase, chloroplastic n=1 Tax=Typha angustifolia TaxID=59011 RepID=UPI003C2EADF3
MASSISLASPITPTTSGTRSVSLPSQNPSSITFFARPLRRHPSLRPPTAVAAIQVEKQDSVKPTTKPPPALPYRIGHGFDLHRLEPGLPLIIGGIDVPHDRGCEAHSDGDVLLHCVVDAILGALGLPDIGQIFPDSDPKWRGAASSVFMREAVRLMHEAGYELGNLDATLILQRPKLSPHKEAIRANLSELLGADPAVVNLKAKTHEKVDSLGENRSIAAHTVVLLMRK